MLTAVVGGYERLTEQPIARDSEVRFVCLTDDPAFTSRTWEVRPLRPILPFDPIRSARDVKIRAHRYVDDVDELLWIDNSVLLTTPPEELLAEWLADADVAMPSHSFRETVGDEFAEVAHLGLDDLTRIYEQWAHYRAQAPSVLDEQVPWTAILARRPRARGVREFAETWMDHVMRYSRRDQLSVNLALKHGKPQVRFTELDNHASQHHSWPVSQGRGPAESRRHRHDFVPLSVAAAQHEAQQAALRAELDRVGALLLATADQRDQLAGQLDSSTEQLRTSDQLAASRDEDLSRERVARVDAERRLAAVLESRSFRVTAGPRQAARIARRALRSRRP